MRSRCVSHFCLLRSFLCIFLFFTGSALAAAADATKGAARSQDVCVANVGDLPVARARLLAFGNYRGPRASRNDEAQRFFDQGLVFGWGFNFAEAVRSFRAAVQFDPDCALCRWGIAWALGPSINHDMAASDVPVALDAIVQARIRAAPGSYERALIDALAQRYSDRPGADAGQLARSYAAAMRTVANRYPDDSDLAVLAAEAMMNSHAYDYWRADGRPQAWTPQIIAWLARALRLAPAHPGAHHYQIHLFEDSPHPERALVSAGELGALAPLVGHLVHMPSHIYFRLGRYGDAVRANSAAVQADRDYAAAAGAGSDYAIHNLHFLWASALWNADNKTAVRAADQLAETAAALPADEVGEGTRQHFLAAPALTRVRLGLSDVRLPDPNAGPYKRGLTHFANGMAYAGRGDLASARAELASLRASSLAAGNAALTVKNINRASDVLAVAVALLESAIATASGANGEAVRHARAAVVAEDRLATDDPPVWVLPARHSLGAALLRAGRAAEAQSVYRADLRRYPQNCVALSGLAASKLRSSHVSLEPAAPTSARFPLCPE